MARETVKTSVKTRGKVPVDPGANFAGIRLQMSKSGKPKTSPRPGTASALGLLGRRDGMSILEFLVAVTVLTIAAAGLFAIASSATTKNTMARDQSTAVQLAVDKLEELRNTAFEDLASGADTSPVTAGAAAGGIYTRLWTVTSRTIGSAPARDLAVTVSWTNGGSVSLTTSVVQPNVIVPGYFDEFSTVAIHSWDQSR
jgi:Tfp pilus assembly protein PilV